MKKICPVIWWIITFQFCGFVFGESEEPRTYPDPTRYEKAILAFEEQDQELPPPAGAILCIGSSSMRGWNNKIAEDLSPLTVIARGFGGSNMNDVLHYMDRVVLPYKPRAILLYEGDNDITLGISPEAFLEVFQVFLARLHRDLPETRVYVLSVKPSIDRWKIWGQMEEANRLLAGECAGNDLLTYIDVANPMLDENGYPLEELFISDKLHMNRIGYIIWRNAVKPVLMAKEFSFE